jgi:hypothetical protein
LSRESKTAPAMKKRHMLPVSFIPVWNVWEEFCVMHRSTNTFNWQPRNFQGVGEMSAILTDSDLTGHSSPHNFYSQCFVFDWCLVLTLHASNFYGLNAFCILTVQIYVFLKGIPRILVVSWTF